MGAVGSGAVIEVSSCVDIARPPERVFAVIADMSRNTEWQKGMKDCRWTSEDPIGVGSTYDQTASFLGRRIVTSFEVIEHDAPRRIRIRSTASTFPLDITRTVTATTAGSRVEALVRGDPGRFAMFLRPLVQAMVARSVRGDYRRLKEMLESEGAA